MADPVEIAIDPELEAQVFSQVVGGEALRFRVYWNRREKAYSIDFRDVEDNEIAGGVKVVVGYDLWIDIQDDRLPSGALIALDTSGQDKRPGKYDLGARVKLVYLPA